MVTSLVFLIRLVYSANECRRIIKYFNFFQSIGDRARRSRSDSSDISSSSQFRRGIHKRIAQSIISYVEFHRIGMSLTIRSNRTVRGFRPPYLIRAR